MQNNQEEMLTILEILNSLSFLKTSQFLHQKLGGGGENIMDPESIHFSFNKFLC